MRARFQGQHVLVLGLGVSGLAMARWCTAGGAARVTVWDSREQPPQAAALSADCPQANLISGDLPASMLRADVDRPAVDWVLKSPGLMPHDPLIAGLWTAAHDQGVRTGGELDLFALALKDLAEDLGYAPQVLAITGTNGKTTTTSLTALLTERAGLRTAMAGNIGPCLLDTLAEALCRAPAEAMDAARHAQAQAAIPEVPPSSAPKGDIDGLPQVWVLELSSFQLHEVRDFEPTAATVLNITQDHLDWHGSLAAYAADKARIFGRRGVRVLNRDDERVAAMAPAAPTLAPADTPARGARGARGAASAGLEDLPQVVTFGLTPPTRAGDFGLVVEGGMAWLVRALPVDETPSRRSRSRAQAFAGAVHEEELHIQRLMPADALRIRGRHNASNALAALALATAAGCALAPMLHGLREYRGEPHRVEWIGSVGGVEAFDDSKGTNVGATVAALEGLGADRAPSKLVVILGGDGKGQDFEPLAEPVARHARAVALIGRDADRIEATLQAHVGAAQVVHQRFDRLEDAVPWCFEQAQGHDAVLLSPACASLDMFRNYAHRAEVFIEAVRELALARGEALA